MEQKIKDFIGVKVEYMPDGQNIFGYHKDGGLQNLLDVRGWGATQNLFMKKNGEVAFKDAQEFQDSVGEWIADAINQKLNKYAE